MTQNDRRFVFQASNRNSHSLLLPFPSRVVASSSTLRVSPIPPNKWLVVLLHPTPAQPTTPAQPSPVNQGFKTSTTSKPPPFLDS